MKSQSDLLQTASNCSFPALGFGGKLLNRGQGLLKSLVKATSFKIGKLGDLSSVEVDLSLLHSCRADHILYQGRILLTQMRVQSLTMEKTVSTEHSVSVTENRRTCEAEQDSVYPAPPVFTPEISKLHCGEVGAADQKTGELFAFAASFEELHTLVTSLHLGRQYCAVVIR